MFSVHQSHPRRGIMRTEVVAVILVAILLAALLLPLIVSSRNQSRRSIVKDRLRNMGTQVRVYHDTFQSLPSMGGSPTAKKPETTKERLERIGQSVLEQQKLMKEQP